MKLKDLFQDYLVNYEASTRSIPITISENIEIPTNKYSRMLSYAQSKKYDEKTPTEEPEKITIKWAYSTPSEGIVTTVNKSWSSPYSEQNKWVADMTAAYKRAGLNDNAIKNLIAKNALESGWGKSAQGDYNFGNITAGKSWTGRIVEGGDKNAAGKAITQKFRAYDSLDDYVKDEIQFLTNLYDFNQDDDISKFLDKLQGGNSAGRKYAEDPSYKNKVKSIYLKS